MEKRKVGRPKKMVRLEADVTMDVHTKIAKRYRDMVPDDISWRDLLEWAIEARYGDKIKREMREIDERLALAEKEFLMAKALKVAAEERLKQEEELRKALRIEEKYAVRAFRHMINFMLKTHSSRRKISIYQEIIEKRWGITFDRRKLDSEFEEFLISFEAGLVSDEEIIQKYSVRRININAEFEREIRNQIEAELGVS